MQILLYAQSTQLESITVADGLSQGFISDILQTQDGFLWFPTKDGLNRYDGYNFKIYVEAPFDPHSLSGNNVWRLFEDSQKRLWVGTTHSGLNVLDRRSERFFHLNFRQGNKAELAQMTIEAIAEDPTGAIWIAPSDDYILKLTLPKKFPTATHLAVDTIPYLQLLDFSIKTPPIFQKNNTAFCFHLRPDSTLYLGSQHGLYQIDWKNDRLISIPIPAIPKEGVQGVADIFEDTEGTLWLLRSEFITRWAQGKGQHVPAFKITQISQSKEEDKYFWISGDSKLYRIHPTDTRLLADWEWKTFADADHAIRSHYIDEGGLVWLGTTGLGLKKYDPKKRKFQHFFEGQTFYRMLFDQAGQFWFRGSGEDYYQLNFSDNTRSNTGFFNNEFHKVFHLIQDQSGVFWAWVATGEVGELYFIKRQSQTTPIVKYPMPVQRKYEFSGELLETSSGQIWAAGPGGFLARYNASADTFDFFENDSIANRLGEKNLVVDFIEDANHHFWIGTNNGLLQVLPPQTASEQPIYRLYQNNPKNRNSLRHNHVSSLLDDPEHPYRYLWVGTKGGGLNRLDKQRGTFLHFGIADGLPNRVIYGLLSDGEKNVWMSTNQGLSQFNLTTRIFKNFSSADGLQSDEFNTFSYLKSADGRLFFGGVNGLNVFQPEDIQFNTHIPKIVIVGLKVNNKTVQFEKATVDTLHSRPILKVPIEQTTTIELAHDQNHISLEFAALDFANPKKNQYRYQLEGVDETFIEAGNRRIANYAHLKPGAYRFKVMGANNDGLWNETPRILNIHIRPPWWQTKLAYALYILMIMGILFALYRFQIKRIQLQNQLAFEQKEAERLAQLDRLKTEFFSNITHEFRTPLSLIIDPLQQAIKDIRDEKTLQNLLLVQRNSDKLLLLINQLLDLNKLESQSMKVSLSRGNFVDFTKTVIESFLGMAKKKGIVLDFQYTSELPDFSFDVEKCRKLLYNLLGNAVKFTREGGQIIVRLDWTNFENLSNLSITISDTGIGIPQLELPKIFDRFYQVDSSHTRSNEGTGIGLALTKALTELMGGSIEVASEEGKGTTFRVTLPMLQQTEAFEETALTATPTPLLLPLPPSISENHIVEKTVVLDDSKELVLIVEDNADIRSYLSQSLPTTTFQLIEATDGIDGLRKATKYLPDLIISDVMMPGMDGFELLDFLKKDARTCHIPVVMLTAKAATASKLKGLKSGADAYLSKPFSIEELSVRIEKLLEQRKRWQAYFRKNGSLKTEDNPLPSADQKLLERLSSIIEANLSDENFGIEQLCKAANMSRYTLHRKLKALTNLSTSRFIRSFRLERAYHLLENQAGNVSEIAFQTGFNSLQYFSKCFKEEFGQSPANLLR